MKSILFFALLLAAPSTFAADTCAALVSKSESLADQNSWDDAKATAMKAIAACKTEKQKTARPYMVMAVAANAAGDSQSVIKWSKEAASVEPGSAGLAYMNICSAYYVMKSYDEAVAACKQGLVVKGQHPWKAKINHNLGLALFNKYVAANAFADVAKAEPYFKESSKLDPSLAANYFYIGTIESAGKGNAAEGAKWLKQGCEKGDQRSCDSAAKLASSSASQQASQPSASQPTAHSAEASQGASVAFTADETKLLAQMKQNYMKKGLPAASADQIVANMKKSLGSLPPDQRAAALKQMVDASK